MKKIFRIAIILIIVAAAILGYAAYKKTKNKPEWRLDSVNVGNIREEVTASGTLNPFTLVNVGTEISGKIAKLYKDFNSTVTKGELLAKLDTENLETSLESSQTDVQRAQTGVNDAKLDLDLQKELYQNNMGTSYDYQKAQNKYDQALQALANSRFALKRAEKNLQNAIITSPIDGVIVSRNVDEGQTVAASLNAPTLFVIANNLQQMQINADIDEADIGRIRIGMPVEFTVDAFADENFEGKVKQVRLSPKAEQNVVTYSVIIDVNNPQLKLLPGMTANVTIIIREMENVLRIPESALRFKPSKELWKLFGLPWDDKLTARPSRRGGGQSTGVGDRASAHAGRGNESQAHGGEMGNRRAMPESLRAKFAAMTSEQKAAFKEKMRKAGGRPDFSKLTPEQRAAFRKKRMPENSQTADNQTSFAAETQTFVKQNKGRIWVLVNGKPKSVEVVTGLSDGNFAEVISGVKEEQEMIIGVNYKNAKQAAASSTLPFGGGMGQRH
jgi:HlyD family secretion protein